MNINTLIFSIVQSALIILKLCEVTVITTWSWLMVFTPLWIYLSLLFVWVIIFVVCALAVVKRRIF